MYVKKLLKRYGWDLMIFCNIFLISLFTLKIINKYENIYLIANQSSDALSNIAIHFKIDTYEMIDFSFLEEEEISYALLQKVSDSMPIFKVVYSNNYFEVSNGRSFTNNDFNGSDHIALAGSKAGEILQVEPFIFRSQEYNVIGNLLEKNTLESKYAVFFTDGDIKEYIPILEFILEGFTQKDIRKIYEIIEDKMEELGHSVKRIKIKTTKFEDVYNVNEESAKIGILVVLSICSTILLLTYFWLGGFDELYQVYYLFGLKHFIKKIFIKFQFFIIVGYILAFLCQKTIFLMTNIYIFIILNIIMVIVLFGGIAYKKRGDWNEEDSGRNIV